MGGGGRNKNVLGGKKIEKIISGGGGGQGWGGWHLTSLRHSRKNMSPKEISQPVTPTISDLFLSWFGLDSLCIKGYYVLKDELVSDQCLPSHRNQSTDLQSTDWFLHDQNICC